MHICKYLNQTATVLGNRMDYLSKLLQKPKKEKTHEEIQFYNSIQD